MYSISCLCKSLYTRGLPDYAIEIHFPLFTKQSLLTKRLADLKQGCYTNESSYDHRDIELLQNFVFYFVIAFKVSASNKPTVKYFDADTKSPLSEQQILGDARFAYIHNTIRFKMEVLDNGDLFNAYTDILNTKHGLVKKIQFWIIMARKYTSRVSIKII